MAGRIFAVIVVSPAYSVASVAGDGGPRVIVGLGLAIGTRAISGRSEATARSRLIV